MIPRYKITTKPTISFRSGLGESVSVQTQVFANAVKEAHKIIDQISEFEVDIFSILGMRNLSAFVGELYAASLIKSTDSQFRKNPHQDGYPDLLLMDRKGQVLYEEIKAAGKVREKLPFSPFENGGLEIKATCGSVPTPDRCRKMGLQEKPDIGDQRIQLMTGYDWKAHHRETNYLVGILWDFINGLPRIVAVFFCETLTEDDWGKIVQPKDGGGRTTSVSIMSRTGIKKMYENWVVVIESDERYAKFLNKYNSGTAI